MGDGLSSWCRELIGVVRDLGFISLESRPGKVRVERCEMLETLSLEGLANDLPKS